RIDVLKMDIEGSEAAAILGGRELIRNSPDLRIIMEWWPGHVNRSPRRREQIGAMWSFLLDEREFKGWQIMTETGPGVAPRLCRLNDLEAIMSVPHGDLYLERP